MRSIITYQLSPKEIHVLKTVLPEFSKQFSRVCFLNSNSYKDQYSLYDCAIALGAIDEIKANTDSNSFEALRLYYDEKKDWLFGYFSYDLKNELENLVSNNDDGIQLPEMHFFRPEFILFLKDHSLDIHYDQSFTSERNAEKIYADLSKNLTGNKWVDYDLSEISIKNKISKADYIESIKEIKTHIQQGDIYEMNFCQEFFAEKCSIDPAFIYHQLNELSPMPFSCFYRLDKQYLMCASPERFLQKKGNKIISQPIKGTIKRDSNEKRDHELRSILLNDGKERSENVMIVDLVRNDLSKTSAKGSVKVEELFGIYSFKNIHQMISTISSDKRGDIHFVDVIANAFPMGSMTGAPKIRAMQLIEQYESTKRGLYSGAVGYITPDGDFDFNVVIRSIIYNESSKYLSFMVGSAITSQSDPKKEYEECLLKAQAMLTLLT